MVPVFHFHFLYVELKTWIPHPFLYSGSYKSRSGNSEVLCWARQQTKYQSCWENTFYCSTAALNKAGGHINTSPQDCQRINNWDLHRCSQSKLVKSKHIALAKAKTKRRMAWSTRCGIKKEKEEAGAGDGRVSERLFFIFTFIFFSLFLILFRREAGSCSVFGEIAYIKGSASRPNNGSRSCFRHTKREYIVCPSVERYTTWHFKCHLLLLFTNPFSLDLGFIIMLSYSSHLPTCSLLLS